MVCGDFCVVDNVIFMGTVNMSSVTSKDSELAHCCCLSVEINVFRVNIVFNRACTQLSGTVYNLVHTTTQKWTYISISTSLPNAKGNTCPMPPESCDGSEPI